MIKSKRFMIDFLETVSPDQLLDYYCLNQSHLARWEPAREAEFYTIDYWENTLNTAKIAHLAGRDYKFVILTEDRSSVIGVCNYTNTIRRAFQACLLGYSIDKRYEGQGIMKETLEATIQYMFEEIGLNRIMANYLPHNNRSEGLLKSLGFEKEGYARRYLKINGIWQDHVLTAKINEN